MQSWNPLRTNQKTAKYGDKVNPPIRINLPESSALQYPIVMSGLESSMSCRVAVTYGFSNHSCKLLEAQFPVTDRARSKIAQIMTKSLTHPCPPPLSFCQLFVEVECPVAVSVCRLCTPTTTLTFKLFPTIIFKTR